LLRGPTSCATASAYTTLFRSGGVLRAGATNPAFLPALAALNAYVQQGGARIDTDFNDVTIEQPLVSDPFEAEPDGGLTKLGEGTDRKSTRLNSSHVQISYAVF